MPFIIARDLCVNYRFDGPPDAPVVMFGNSLGTNLAMWDAQIDALAGDFRLLRYDIRGHGLTETGARTDVTMATLADDASALLDALEIDRVAYVGLSIGGMIAQSLAARAAHRVRALALCATAAKIGSPQLWADRIATAERDGVGALVPGTLQRWFTPPTHAARPDLIRFAATMLQRTPAAGYVAACGALRDADLAAANATIAAPTLVIAGSDDPVTTPADGAALCATVPGATMVTIPGAAHIICAERPAGFNAELGAFLRRTVTAGAPA